MAEFLTTSDLAKVLNVTPRAVALRAEKEGWPWIKDGRKKGFYREELPVDIQTHLVDLLDADAVGALAEARVYNMVRNEDRQTAMYRMMVVQHAKQARSRGMNLTTFTASYNAGSYPLVFKILGKLSAKTLYRWIQGVDHDNIAAVVPKWSLRSKERARGVLTEMEKEALRAWYLDQRKPSAASCYHRLVNGPLQSKASYATVLRYLTGGLDKSLVSLYREGPTAFRDKYMPTVVRDPTAYSPMEQVQSDHHNFDFFINAGNELRRPWVTVMVDYSSGKVLSWMPSMAPNSSVIGMAFYLMVTKYSAPVEIHTDNGKDYLAKSLTGTAVNWGQEDEAKEAELQGLYALCGTRLILATPYNGKSKGRTERMFGSIKAYFDKQFPTYTGSNTVTKPEEAKLLHRRIGKLAKRKVEGLDFTVFSQALDEFFTNWNAQWRGEAKGRSGMTADEAFTSRASVAKTVNMGLLENHFGTPFLRTVGKYGVELDHVHYYHRSLLEHYFGQKVLVRRLWHRPGEVVVSDQEGRLIARAIAGQFNETADLDKVMRFKAQEIRYFTNKAHLLKARTSENEGPFFQLAAGAEHQALPEEKEAPRASSKPKLISPLDVGLEG